MGTRNFFNPAVMGSRNPGLYMGARSVNASRYLGDAAGRQAAGDVAAAAALNKARPMALQRGPQRAPGPKV
jgi:hypothetical protein